MQAGTVNRLEKNVDQAASVLFGVACGYSAHLMFAAESRLGSAVVMALAGALALVAYLLSFRILSSVQAEARTLPVREFRLREVEPLEADDFEALEPRDIPAFDRAETRGLLPPPSDGTSETAELLLTESYAPAEPQAVHLEELELSVVVDEAPVEEQGSLSDTRPEHPLAQSRVVSLFDAAAMPTPGQLGTRIDRHLQREPDAAQSAEAAQALQDALAELRRAIPNRRG